jgi:putative phosphoesterase
MRIGVVSDTHGHLQNTLSAVRMLEELQVEAVLHCGDIGTPEIPPAFSAWPTHFVFGNCDHDEVDLRRAIEMSGLTCHDRFGDLSLGGRRIALVHSDDVRRFRFAIDSGDYDLVCYGHSHKAEFHTKGSTLVLNPGALYRANPHSLAVVDLKTLEPTIIPIE